MRLTRLLSRFFHSPSPAFNKILVFICACLACSLIAAAPGMDERVTAAKIPGPDHVVIVIEENKAYGQIIGNPDAPYINRLAAAGALFTQSFAVTHPSQPNYLALFSGSTQGIKNDACPQQLSGANLASELMKKGLTFGIYSESMPATGYTGCFADIYLYARKHNPAVNWQGNNVPPAVNMPFNEFPRDYARLPTVSMVIPNQVNDMHSGVSQDELIKRGDTWLKDNLDTYIEWAMQHNSLFILTWDEDDSSSSNHIPTVFVGPMVTPGRYDDRVDHYRVLRTLVEMFGLSPLGTTATVQPIQDIWTTELQR
jgi:phospholipase C